MRLGAKIEPTTAMRELLDSCTEWYNRPGNGCGGDLHVVLDDDNTSDHWLGVYLKETTDPLGVRILKGLQLLSQDQRNWVTYNAGAGEGEPYDVHKELEDA